MATISRRRVVLGRKTCQTSGRASVGEQTRISVREGHVASLESSATPPEKYLTRYFALDVPAFKDHDWRRREEKKKERKKKKGGNKKKLFLSGSHWRQLEVGTLTLGLSRILSNFCTVMSFLLSPPTFVSLRFLSLFVSLLNEAASRSLR